MNQPIIINQLFGGLWTVGWLFTVGYLGFGFWKGIWALFVWPFYLGKYYKK